jgi:hypothetical protein
MASYTDKIPTFNPYVEQQPVDAMLKVGVYKQKMYEEGVKKIQTTIDNVAGLDIANEVQQKYLQSKLNALGNNLTFLAAGDFSDFSLVNSVNGMTKQIAKDDDVINAVSSTAKLRAGYKKKAELAKKGLTDKNNDDYYDMFASDYVNSKDLKASFNADYVPYTNIVKKLKDALVGVGQSETIAEQIFVTGADGKPLVINGKYQYADAKTIEKLVTNKPAVIAAINNVLNEGNVKQQIGIDGWATYRNTEATTLLEPLKADYDNERSRLQQQGLEITAMLNGTNLSPEQKQMYINAAAENEAALLKNDNTFMTLSKEAEDNPESFKQSYYTQEFKQRLLNQFLDEDSSKTYGTNEALQQQNYRDDMAFKKAQERNKVANENAKLALDRAKYDLDYLKFLGDYEIDSVTGNVNKKPEPGKGKGPGGKYDANKPLFSGSNPGDKVNSQNIVDTDINTLSTDKNKMAFDLYANFIRTNKNNPSLDDKAILAQVNVYAKQKGITTEAFLDRWAMNIKNKYDENGLIPPPNINEEFDAYINTSSTLNNKVNLKKSARESANKEADVDGKLKQLLAGHSTLTFNIDGQKYTATPEDILNMERSGLIQQLALGYGSAVRDKFTLNDKKLTANQNRFLSQWYKMSPEMQKQIFKESDAFKRQGLRNYTDALDKAEKIYNDKLAKVVGVTDSVTGFLPMDTESKPTTIGMVATYVNGGERNYAPGVDKQAVIDALDNATAISWKGKKPTNAREEWTGEIIVTGPKGTTPVTITNVNRQDLETFTGAKFTQYQEKPIQDAINMNEKTKSTNPVYMVNSPNAWKTSYFKGTNINPAVTQAGWSYRADVVRSGGGYRLVNYVRPPKAKGYTTIYGAAIANDENIIDNIYKTTSPAELSAMYLNYLHNQKK